MTTPTELRDFNCDDYFASEWRERGLWDEPAQLMFIVSARDLVVENDFLIIGRPGVDGIAFGYRRGLDGVWALAPMFQEWTRVADSTADLVEGWYSGRITV